MATDLSDELINDAIERKPELKQFTRDQWQQTFDTLTGQGLSLSNFMTVIMKRPQLLRRPSQKLIDSIDSLRNAEFLSKDIFLLLEKHPEFLGNGTRPCATIGMMVRSYQHLTRDCFQKSTIPSE